MRAVICSSFAPIDALEIGEIDPPGLTPNGVRIAVKAAGVNFLDGLIVQGKYQTKPPLPFVPGSEVAGVVESVGTDVRDFAIGDHVAAFTATGAFAELVTVPATQVFPLPRAVDPKVAAGILVTYGTSYHALKDRALLRPGETLLVLGAAGGVGLSAVELGVLMGARVIAAASTPEKLALAREYGAVEAIDYTKENLRERVKALTGGNGADVVYDPVGGSNTLDALKSLAWGGRLLVIGFAAGDIPQIPANLLLLKSASAVGVLWGSSLLADPAHHARNIADLIKWLDNGRIRPAIDSLFPLERAIKGIQRVMNRQAQGKVVITIDKGR